MLTKNMEDKMTTRMLVPEDIDTNTPVKIYKNKPKNLWSVQVKTEKGWRVKGHIKIARVNNGRFQVNEKTRQKIVEQGKKYVHAFVIGEWCQHWTLYGDHGCVEFVKYNPYKHKEFRTTDWYGNKPISPDWRGIVYFGKDGNVTKVKKGGPN